MKKNYIAVCLAGIAALNLGTVANANIILNNGRQTGNEYGYGLGMDFTVNSSVSVTALGTFDSNISGLSDPVTSSQIAASLGPQYWSSQIPLAISVGIFDVKTGLEVSPTVTFNYNDAGLGLYYAVAGSIFQNITPFTLGPGTYSIVAVGYTYLFFSGDTQVPSPGVSTPVFDPLLGALTLLPNGARASNYGNTTFELPTYYTGATEGGGSPDFLAGTFIASTPDGGSTIALLGFALAGMGGLRRKLNR